MPASLGEWLAHIERVHARPIELGLERVQQVKQAMGLAQTCPVITVAGTNGKGSTCAMIDSVLRAAHYRVGLYTSPHLLAYNERVRVDGAAVADELLCAGFAAVDAARGDVPLTYFEFGTLGAWHAFQDAGLDAVILEVGLGGRLDAVNAFDADVAVITGIDLDHMEFLGPDRESIGREKAGVFRPGRPAIVADARPPASVVAHAETIGAELRLIGRDFGYLAEPQQWQYWSRQGDRLRRRSGLAHPGLRGANQLSNASAAIAAVEALENQLPVSQQHLRQGLIEVEFPGRFQAVPGRPMVVLDVAHNPQAAGVLADNLGSQGYFPETWAVFGMLADKDIAGVVRRIAHRIDRWLLADLSGARAASAVQLEEALYGAGVSAPAEHFGDPASAFVAAQKRVAQDDRIVVFGSFLTVADAMRVLARR